MLKAMVKKVTWKDKNIMMKMNKICNSRKIFKNISQKNNKMISKVIYYVNKVLNINHSIKENGNGLNR